MVKRNEPVPRQKARFTAGMANALLELPTPLAAQQPNRGNPLLRSARADLLQREVDRPVESDGSNVELPLPIKRRRRCREAAAR
jgi:hypothetical protein